MGLYIGLDSGWKRFRYRVLDGLGRQKETGWGEMDSVVFMAQGEKVP